MQEHSELAFGPRSLKNFYLALTKSVPYSPEAAPEQTELYVNDLELFLQ